MTRTEGTNFVDAAGALAYTQKRHGPDGAVLLDPYFTSEIADYCNGAEVLDVGCGAAPWAIFTAKVGAKAVMAVDNSEQMLSQAEAALAAESPEVQAKILISAEDALNLPWSSEKFDAALSVNVGCALPSIERGRYDRGHHITPLLRHFQEMARVLKPEGVGIITAPASLETVFTTFGEEDEKIDALEKELDELAGENDEEMRKVVSGHDDILRATIVPDARGWRLIHNQELGGLATGLPIWRKLPGLVVPNYNHPAQEYATALTLAGLDTDVKQSPTLDPDDYNAQTGLGKQYVENNPFDIYVVENPAR